MTFSNEIVSEADEAAFDFRQIKRPPLYLDPIWPYQWTIDRDRRVFLMATAGVGNDEARSVKHFILWIEEEMVRLQLNHVAVGENAEHVTSTWHLLEMSLPRRLRGDRERVLEALREALTAYRVAGVMVTVRSHQAVFQF